jgi:hypothetical protein
MSENTCHIFSRQNYIYLLYFDCHVKQVDVILAGKIIMTSVWALHANTIKPTIVLVDILHPHHRCLTLSPVSGGGALSLAF